MANELHLVVFIRQRDRYISLSAVTFETSSHFPLKHIAARQLRQTRIFIFHARIGTSTCTTGRQMGVVTRSIGYFYKSLTFGDSKCLSRWQSFDWLSSLIKTHHTNLRDAGLVDAIQYLCSFIRRKRGRWGQVGGKNAERKLSVFAFNSIFWILKASAKRHYSSDEWNKQWWPKLANE